MGSLFAKEIEPDIHSSSSDECDDEIDSGNENMPASTDHQADQTNLDTDAICPNSPNNYQNFTNITLSSINIIEKELDDYEKSSLMFLLCEDVQKILNRVTLNEFLSNGNISNWQEKVVEALAIIKNFQILKKFGFSKDDLVNEYYPYSYFTTRCIPKVRKVLYIVCERLGNNEETAVLRNIELDFRKQNLKFEKFPQMELYLSYFLKIGYITENNVQNIIQIFKSMQLDDVCEMMKDFQEKQVTNTVNIENRDYVDDRTFPVNRSFSSDDTNRNVETFSNSDVSLAESNSTQDNAQVSGFNLVHTTRPALAISADDVYDTSKDRICLIINQENFHTEFREAYKHLLPDNIEEEKLHTRQGTSCDADRLEKTLKNRRFKVDTEKNLTHLDIISELENAVQKIDPKNCSCFFVIILSHGDEGVVYGTNSCYIEVSTLIEIMCKRKLDNIPKILITQSCQGGKLQKVPRRDEDLETDGPLLRHNPDTKDPDFLLFCSTVAGYSSIRNKQTGTWFIQSLCNQLDNVGDYEHFEEICLKIKHEVTNKRWATEDQGEYYMVPISKSTLTKKLFLKR